jgi:hypothetical protein
MSFRSQQGVDRFCDGLTITETIKAQGEICLKKWQNGSTGGGLLKGNIQ